MSRIRAPLTLQCPKEVVLTLGQPEMETAFQPVRYLLMVLTLENEPKKPSLENKGKVTFFIATNASFTLATVKPIKLIITICSYLEVHLKI